MIRTLSSALAAIALLSQGCGRSPASKPPEEPSPTASSTSASPTPLPTATASKSSEKTLFVRETLADCEGEGPMKCLPVREKETDEWTLFYSEIEGFTHEAGYRYELRVEVKPRANAPADASSLEYRLVKVVAKEQVTSGTD